MPKKKTLKNFFCGCCTEEVTGSPESTVTLVHRYVDDHYKVQEDERVFHLCEDCFLMVKADVWGAIKANRHAGTTPTIPTTDRPGPSARSISFGELGSHTTVMTAPIDRRGRG